MIGTFRSLVVPVNKDDRIKRLFIELYKSYDSSLYSSDETTKHFYEIEVMTFTATKHFDETTKRFDGV